MRARPLLLATATAIACALALLPASGLAEINAQGSEHSVELRGSASIYPLAQKVAEAYMLEHPQASVVLAPESSYRGLKAMIVGTAEIAMATDAVPEDLAKLAKDDGVKFQRYDIYRDGIVPIVSPANAATTLTLKQLHDVFRGTIVNWKDLGGPDLPIHVLTHDGTSGTFETFKRAVLGDSAVITPAAHTVATHQEMLDILGKDPGAIGYAGMHEAQGVKMLAVDGVAADAASIASGRYALRRQLSLYAREPASGEAKSFIDFFLDPAKGQTMVREQGDVPMK